MRARALQRFFSTQGLGVAMSDFYSLLLDSKNANCKKESSVDFAKESSVDSAALAIFGTLWARILESNAISLTPRERLKSHAEVKFHHLTSQDSLVFLESKHTDSKSLVSRPHARILKSHCLDSQTRNSKAQVLESSNSDSAIFTSKVSHTLESNNSESHAFTSKDSQTPESNFFFQGGTRGARIKQAPRPYPPLRTPQTPYDSFKVGGNSSVTPILDSMAERIYLSAGENAVSKKVENLESSVDSKNASGGESTAIESLHDSTTITCVPSWCESVEKRGQECLRNAEARGRNSEALPLNEKKRSFILFGVKVASGNLASEGINPFSFCDKRVGEVFKTSKVKNRESEYLDSEWLDSKTSEANHAQKAKTLDSKQLVFKAFEIFSESQSLDSQKIESLESKKKNLNDTHTLRVESLETKRLDSKNTKTSQTPKVNFTESKTLDSIPPHNANIALESSVNSSARVRAMTESSALKRVDFHPSAMLSAKSSVPESTDSTNPKMFLESSLAHKPRARKKASFAMPKASQTPQNLQNLSWFLRLACVQFW